MSGLKQITLIDFGNIGHLAANDIKSDILQFWTSSNIGKHSYFYVHVSCLMSDLSCTDLYKAFQKMINATS